MLLAALAAALLVVVLGFLLLKGNGDDKGNQASKTSTPTRDGDGEEEGDADARRPRPRRPRRRRPPPTATETPTPTAPRAAAHRAAARASSSSQAYNLNNAGKYDEALPVAQQAVAKGCKGNAPVSPCGYALYELGRAQLGTGDAAGRGRDAQTSGCSATPTTSAAPSRSCSKKAQKDAEKG